MVIEAVLKGVAFKNPDPGNLELAMSTSCSKFPEKLLLFRKVANLRPYSLND